MQKIFIEQGSNNENINSEHYIKIDNAIIYCRLMGKGEPLIVIHGGPGLTMDYLLPQMEKLAEDQLVVFYDQRGNGKSTGEINDKTMQLDVFIKDLLAIQNHFGWNEVGLLGHSWGAYLAMHHATQYPKRVNKLILLNSIPSSVTKEELSTKQPDPYESMIQSILEASKKDSNQLNQYYKNLFQYFFYDPKMVEQLTLNMTDQQVKNSALIHKLFEENFFHQAHDLQPSLRKLKNIPTLIIHGNKHDLPTSVAKELHQSIEGSILYIIKAGHFPFAEDKTLLFQCIARFNEYSRSRSHLKMMGKHLTFLPNTVLQNTYDRLTIKDLKNLFSTSRFFHPSLREYKKIRPDLIKYNLKNNFRNKRVSHDLRLENHGYWKSIIPAKNGFLVVTPRSITLIDKETATVQWDFQSESLLLWQNHVWIKNDYLICTGTYPSPNDKMIALFSLKTGEIIKVLHEPLLHVGSVQVVGDQVFAKCANVKIYAWDLPSLELSKTYNELVPGSSLSPRKYDPENLVVTNNYLIEIDKDDFKLIVTDRTDNKQMEIILPSLLLDCIPHQQDLLICALSSLVTSKPEAEVVIIDLKLRKITERFVRKHEERDTWSINTLVAKENFFVALFSSGGLYSTNFVTSAATSLLKKESYTPNTFWLFDDFLFVPIAEKSYIGPRIFTAIAIYDLKSLSLVTQLNNENIMDLYYQDGCLITIGDPKGTNEPSLHIYDYNVLHQIKNNLIRVEKTDEIKEVKSFMTK